MSHTKKQKEKLLHRVRRIRGQLNAIEKSLERDEECAVVLQTLVACRGALNGLIVELLEGHIRGHIVDPDERSASSPQGKAAHELLEILRVYLR